MLHKFTFTAWLTKEKEREFLTEVPEQVKDTEFEEYEPEYTYRKYIFREKPVLETNKAVSEYPYFAVSVRNPILWNLFDLTDDMDIPFLREENSPIEVECTIVIGMHEDEPQHGFEKTEFNMWIARDSDGDLTMFEAKPELKILGETEYFFSNKGGSWRLETFFNIRHMKRKTVFPFIGFTGKPVPCVVSAVPVELSTEEN